MHYDFEHVALDLPHLVRDETTYLFENRERGQSLSIVREPPELRLSSKSVLHALLRPLASTMGPLVTTAEEEIEFLGHPSACQGEYQLAGVGLRVLFLVAATPQATTIVRWISGPATDEDLAFFRHVIESVQSADQLWLRQGSPGYTRRQVGPLTFEIPWQLGSPSGFAFGTEDDAVRLTMEYVAEPVAAVTPVEQLVSAQSDDESLALQVDDDRPFERAGFACWSGRFGLAWTIGSAPARHQVLRQLRIAIADQLTFRIVGLATESGAPTLDASWLQIENTIARGK